MSEATVSVMGRLMWETMAWNPDPPLNGVISSVMPSHSFMYRW
jgi:dihydrofolate reductase